MSIKTYLKINRTRGISAAPANPGLTISQSGTQAPESEGTIDILPAGNADAGSMDLSGELPAENLDPYQRRVHPGRRHQGTLSKLVSILWNNRPGRPLSQQEITERDEMRKRKELERLLRSEAVIFQNRIITALNTRELCYRYPKSQKDFMVRGIQSVHFDCVVLQPDAIYLRVDVCHLPRRVGILNLVDEGILTDLSLACGHRVLAEYREDIGLWFIVERATGARGIPGHVQLQDMMDGFPVTADSLTIPLGVTVNGKKVYRSIRSLIHILIAGTTGGGKSNMLNVILVTLLSRNKPNDLQLIMIDLKGGLELTHYAGVPHLRKLELENGEEKELITETGVITESAKVPLALEWVVQEAEKRMSIIAKAGYSDIVDYNARRSAKNKLRRIVVVFDELASIKLLDPKAGREAERLLSDLGNRGRAVGIHLIICTQYPDKTVLSTAIKAILNSKLCFACSTYPASMIVLGNGDAKGLAPVGRCILQSGAETMPVQAPFFPKQFRDDLLLQIREGRNIEISQGHDVTELEVLEWALTNNNGYLSRNRLFEQFRPRGLRHAELEEWLHSWDGKQFRIQDGFYTVKPAEGRNPRLLVPVEQNED